MKIIPATKEMGNRIRVIARIKSTKKLPSAFPARPRMNAIATASAVAGAVNIIKTIAIICAKYDKPLSPL
ncbi:hypothetical protein D3C84_1099760 [compost metagenome]